MHIVFVDRTPWWGGDTSSLFALARGLLERNHRCEIITDYPCEHHERFMEAGVRVLHRFPSRPWWYPETWRRRPPGLSRVAKILSAAPLRQLLNPRPDIVHFNNLMARSGIDIRAARSAGAPIVGHVRNLAHTVPLGRSVTDYCDAMIAVSVYVRAQLEGSGVIRSGTRLAAIYNPVSGRDFSVNLEQSSARFELGLPQQGRIIGLPAVLTPRKGQDVAIQAFARVSQLYPDAHLAIAGKELEHAADYAQKLRHLVKTAGLGERISFLGHTAEMGKFYAACDVVLAVAKDGEAFGRVPIEAALAQRATIATRAGATPELVVDGETGLLVEPGDVESLEQALHATLGDPVLLEGLSRRAAGRARKAFAYDAIVGQVERLYEQVRRAASEQRRRPVRLRHALS